MESARRWQPCGVQSLIVDYLHYGDAAVRWKRLPPELKSGVSTVERLLAEMALRKQSNRFLDEIVRGCSGRKARLVDLEELDGRMRDSWAHRSIFQHLCCRGFSFAIDLAMSQRDEQWEGRFQLREEVDLRIAMMPAYWSPAGGERTQQWLFYPANVRRALESVRYYDCHYMRASVPAVALALGRRLRQGWVVLALQSDAASSNVACVREHFRGWRKVLLAAICSLAQADGREVLLPRSDEVLRGIHPQGPTVAETPSCWRTIYDRTAKEFAMEAIDLCEPVNTQLYRCSAPVMSSRFSRTKFSAE